VQPPIRHFAIVALRKAGALRFLSHLDYARAIDRAVRRARLPVKYSEGFNPTAQISFASALPVGVAGERELCQVELERPVNADDVLRALAPQLPDDLAVVDVRVVSGQQRRHLSGLERADYEIQLSPDPDLGMNLLGEAVAAFLDAGTWPVLRETRSRTREVDIRPGVHELRAITPGSADRGPRLQMSLALQQDSLVKPSEVVEALRRLIADCTEGRVGVGVARVTRLGLH